MPEPNAETLTAAQAEPVEAPEPVEGPPEAQPPAEEPQPQQPPEEPPAPTPDWRSLPAVEKIKLGLASRTPIKQRRFRW